MDDQTILKDLQEKIKKEWKLEAIELAKEVLQVAYGQHYWIEYSELDIWTKIDELLIVLNRKNLVHRRNPQEEEDDDYWYFI